MEVGRLKKYVIFTVAMLVVTVLVVTGMAYDFIPERYNLAAYLLIISTMLFALYGLLGVAEQMQSNKRKDILALIQEEKRKEANSSEEVKEEIQAGNADLRI